jgi:glutaredoxin
MLQLYQTEWCPASRRVREHLTELGVDFAEPPEAEAHRAKAAKARRRYLRHSAPARSPSRSRARSSSAASSARG